MKAAQHQRDAGISHFEYALMAGLSKAPARTVRMSVLAMLTAGSLPRLSQVVGRLEQRGWVRRTPDPTDGRYSLATLTDAGLAKVTAARQDHAELRADREGQLSLTWATSAWILHRATTSCAARNLSQPGLLPA